MADPTLTKRLTDYLERQAADCEAMLRLLDGWKPENEDTLDAMLLEQGANEERLHAMVRELTPLRAAWDAAAPSGDERAEVRRLARLAETAATKLAARLLEARRATDAYALRLRNDLGEVRRGRGVVGKYGIGDEGDASFIDRKA